MAALLLRPSQPHHQSLCHRQQLHQRPELHLAEVRSIQPIRGQHHLLQPRGLTSKRGPPSCRASATYYYDANGNATTRPYNGSTQTLTWNHENRLSQVSQSGTTTSVYTYDPDGQRIKKVQGSSTTYYPNQYYEVEVNGGVRGSSVDLYANPDNAPPALPIDPPLDENYDPPVVEGVNLTQTAYLPLVPGTSSNGDGSVSAAAIDSTKIVKYYFFGGQRVAMIRDQSFRYLHTDHLGSTIAETNTNGARTTRREYKAYGQRRNGSSLLATDRTFTGQQSDETGLMYYNARFYDPQIGTFVSPDTIVPNPTMLLDYNRYMYVRGRVMNMTDPTGHVGIADGLTFEPISGGGGGLSYAGAAGAFAAGGAMGITAKIALNADQEDSVIPPSVDSAPDVQQESITFPVIDTSIPGISGAGDGLPSGSVITPDSGPMTPVNAPTTLMPQQEIGDTIVFWRAGEPINAPDNNGNYPSWETVRGSLLADSRSICWSRRIQPPKFGSNASRDTHQ